MKRNLLNDSTSTSHRDLHRDFVALISCFRDIEHREYRRGNDEECRVDKVTSGTDPLASPERQSDRWIISEVPIFVEKSLGLEFLWVWIFLCVMQDCPENSQMRIEITSKKRPTYHALAATMHPFEPNDSADDLWDRTDK